MKHVYSLSEAHPDRPTVLTIGSFDGVHRGHQVLVDALVAEANKLGLQVAVFTFFPHPSVVIHGRQPPFYINRPDEKAALLGNLGVDWVITHPFDDRVRKQTPETFLRLLRRSLDFRQFWCGPDFALGHQREGTVEWLDTHGPSLGYELRVVDAVTHADSIISSSRIRAALRSGDVSDVRRCLGRHIRISGTVIEGDGRGKTIGIPTANLEIWEERAHPACGVYAAYARYRNHCFPSVVNIGYRPTFYGSRDGLSIEAHLLDHDADLYGEELNIDFVARLRPEKRFDTADRLATQIQHDIAQARTILSPAQTNTVTQA